MSVKSARLFLPLLLIAASLVAHADPAPVPARSPSPQASPRVKERARPAINIFRITVENPRGYYGRGGGLPYERVTGTVWFNNETFDTLTDVVLTIKFFDTHWYRNDGSTEYKIGKLEGRQSMSVNYTWDNWQSSRVEPRVIITYKVPGDPVVHSVERSW